MFILGLIIGAVVGFGIGCLVGANNKKTVDASVAKAEQAALDKVAPKS